MSMRLDRAAKSIALSVAVATLLHAMPSPSGAEQVSRPPQRTPDVVYIPTPWFVVYLMLEMAQATSKDVVYDLGCGDGRIVIEAARVYGARGVGIDIDPKRIEESRASALKKKVTERVSFRVEDLFHADIREATVVTMYLLPELNMKIRPKLWRDLAVGTRVVSHGYPMGDWVPDRIDAVAGHPVYLWTITEEIKKRSASER